MKMIKTKPKTITQQTVKGIEIVEQIKSKLHRLKATMRANQKEASYAIIRDIEAML